MVRLSLAVVTYNRLMTLLTGRGRVKKSAVEDTVEEVFKKGMIMG